MADNVSLIEELRQRRADEGQGDAVHPARDWRARTNDGAEGDRPEAREAAEAAEVHIAAFGYFRGVRERAGHIEFQRLKGSWPAPGYAWLPCPVWLPSGTGKGRGQAIMLEYVTGLRVTIRGRNLRPLHERILRQQVFRVTEMGEEADQYLPEEATVVYAIEVSEPEGGKG